MTHRDTDKTFIVQGRENTKMGYQGGPCCRCSRPYESKEELILGEKIQPNPCVECGNIFGASWDKITNERIISAGVCFTCDFWRGYAAKTGDAKSIRINNEHYWLGKATKPGDANGYGGSWFTIKRDTGEEIKTCDLWHQGTIPEHFRQRIPNNAKFVKPEAHQ